jgi:hypothetical protein
MRLQTHVSAALTSDGRISPVADISHFLICLDFGSITVARRLHGFACSGLTIVNGKAFSAVVSDDRRWCFS